jgi:hypothetical protein
MRGQVVLRELDSVISDLWLPSEDPKSRYVKTHRGLVIALGSPALLYDKYEVPYHFHVGDIVQYHYRANLDATTRPWPPDGKLATWVPQFDIDGVWE